MKHLYYSITCFYKKIGKAKETLNFSTTIVMATFFGMNLISLISYYTFYTNNLMFKSSKLSIHLIFSFVVFFVLKHYYNKNKRGEILVKELDKKHKLKPIIFILSLTYILITLSLFLHSGSLVREMNILNN